MPFSKSQKRKISNIQKKKLIEASIKETKKRLKDNIQNEEISSDSDIPSEGETNPDTKGSSSEEETAQEKKLRLTKEYLGILERQESRGDGDDDIEKHAAVSDRLHKDMLEEVGRLHKQIAGNISSADVRHYQYTGHKAAVTCICVSSDHTLAFTGSKDCCILKWCTATGKRLDIIKTRRSKSSEGHSKYILAIAISEDSALLASGGLDKELHIWNPTTFDHLHVFHGHRGAITGLVFRLKSHFLYSASADRLVKVWNVDDRAYVESLFGHEDAINGIDALFRERALTCGGRDRSLRLWKLPEESQLVFHGHKGSIDCVAMIDETHFISGADDGSLGLWSVLKKKPISILLDAHAVLADDGASTDTHIRPTRGSQDSGQSISTEDVPNGKKPFSCRPEPWITAVAAVPNTDLVASGSCDGFIRLWQVASDYKSLRPILSVPVTGFINCLKFSLDGRLLTASVAREHRLGKWSKIKDAKNSVLFIEL